ncbi:Uncharacterised protein [uncultured archaeon]|nr:Uncharacterised protein [uncultured archaeon]
MAEVTLKEIHKDLVSIKKDVHKIKKYFEEDDLNLSDEIKKQIEISRKTPISKMTPSFTRSFAISMNILIFSGERGFVRMAVISNLIKLLQRSIRI